MYIIKLNAIDSTNRYLKAMVSVLPIKDFTAVSAKFQTNGKGQMGKIWHTQKGKNLTASVFKVINNLEIENQFHISRVVALAIYKVLSDYEIPDLHIKWPNDILSANNKICGILIENTIKNKQLSAAIIGIGLNVNQTHFENLPKASSLQIIKGVKYSIDEILKAIITQLKSDFKRLEAKNFDALKSEYDALLYKKNIPSRFKDQNGEMFTGIIKGTDTKGRLKICMVDDGAIKHYNIKTIKMAY